MKCRHCQSQLPEPFLDLGTAPPSNAYLTRAQLSDPELYLPLKLRVCERCWLVQTEDYARPDELFSADYAYFSSTSASWLEHAARYAALMRERLALGGDSFVVEIASNDGYLLRNFVAARVPCLGIEPTASTASAAEAHGVPVLREFFGQLLAERMAREGRRADLIVGNNVYAHVPDIDDFTAGLHALLKPSGTITLEFPHVQHLVTQALFDTVYHEHFSYLSVYTVAQVFAAHHLRVFDVEELSTHGGSLRVYGCHAKDPRPTSTRVEALILSEGNSGLRERATYAALQPRVERIKNALLEFLLAQKAAGRKVAAYGAAAKGNTLLNYAGVRADLLPYVCDAAASKQGKFLPGSRIPIVHPRVLSDAPPEYLLVLPWNLLTEVMEQQAALRARGTRFVRAVPALEVLT